MGEANLIDTGILLDIVYCRRPMHWNAMEFFKGYGNQGLAVENNVIRRCQRSILKYAVKFVTDFCVPLDGSANEDNQRNNWDSMDVTSRSVLFENLIRKSTETIPAGSEGYEFFMIPLVNKAKQYIVQMDEIHVREYMQILPAALTDHLSDSIKETFTYLLPLNSVDGRDTVTIRKALYGHFLMDSMDTAMTLAGLVCLILYGSVGRKKYDFVNFYTEDKSFIRNFMKIREENPAFNMKDGENIKMALKSISFEKPY